MALHSDVVKMLDAIQSRLLLGQLPFYPKIKKRMVPAVLLIPRHVSTRSFRERPSTDPRSSQIKDLLISFDHSLEVLVILGMLHNPLVPLGEPWRISIHVLAHRHTL